MKPSVSTAVNIKSETLILLILLDCSDLKYVVTSQAPFRKKLQVTPGYLASLCWWKLFACTNGHDLTNTFFFQFMSERGHCEWEKLHIRDSHIGWNLSKFKCFHITQTRNNPDNKTLESTSLRHHSNTFASYRVLVQSFICIKLTYKSNTYYRPQCVSYLGGWPNI